MDCPRPTSIWRLLLLSFQLVAVATAVPSCTDPLTLRPHRPAASIPLAQPPPSVWAVLRRFVADTYNTYTPLRSPQTDSYEPISPEPTAPRPSSHLLAKYGDQLVLRFNVTDPAEASNLAAASNTLFLDIWGQSSNWVDIRLAKDVVPSLLGLLPASLQHAHKPLMQGQDLARAIAETYPTNSPSTTRRGSARRMKAFTSPRRKSADQSYYNSDLFFEDYQPLHVIENWMAMMQSEFPSYVQKISVGSTYEGRDISALRVGVRPDGPGIPLSKRDTVLITAGQHAREWISTSTVTYVAYSLISAYGKDSVVTDLLESLDFVFIPTLNPDGYHYTWDFDRLWRKNRQTTSLRFCRGLDLDRSWSFMWDGERTKDNPCSESFAGDEPFEAVESRQFAEWARNETDNNNVQFVGLVDLHSYAQQILYPYSFSCTSYPPTLEDLQELGQGLAKSIRSASREHYKVMSACEGNVAASGEILPHFEGGGGSALDWFYNELNIRKAFQIKLRDKGSYGFLLPAEHIIPTGSEILNLVKHLGHTITTSSSGDEYVSLDENLQTVLTASEPSSYQLERAELSL